MLRRNGSGRSGGGAAELASRLSATRLRSIGSLTRLRRRNSRSSNSPNNDGASSATETRRLARAPSEIEHGDLDNSVADETKSPDSRVEEEMPSQASQHHHSHHHHNHHHHNHHHHHHHHPPHHHQGDGAQNAGNTDDEIEKRRLKPVNSASGMSQEDLRRTIRDIQMDTSLTSAERAKRIQELMTFSWRKSQKDLHAAKESESMRRRASTKSMRRMRNTNNNVPPGHVPRTQSSYFASDGRLAQLRQEERGNQSGEVDSDLGDDDEEVAPLDENDLLKSYHDEENNILGCEHYQRKCMISAPCCNEFFACRFCHNEEMDHEIDRYAVDRVRCMMCSKEQPVAKACVDCGLEFARYYCEPCKFYDDKEGKAIYHCPKCNICRIGEGLGIDYFHCDKCNACMSITLREHKCVERSLESDCPVCHEYMFTSTTPVMFLNCGHCMHVVCYESYTASNYTCPLCSKSLGDMSAYFRRIDQLLKDEKMPAEYAGLRSRIFCSDCETRSIAPYHFVYHKCNDCGSYNTKVLEQLPKEDEEEAAAAVTAAAQS
ncbi:Zinc finger protein BRUTUS [Hondaea fermentalgiana]|uniref:Zinc finger protein BRUTUS n=1 Tax=Hondaea fermentalgiana TaxID=2315210 RepID=A0A2R5G555_9STRA|nr:Zinc finger protein BRUTUS [Hondaea fermentalgiana]|eukprot:GBG24918.1 Zinc finger protein BRUTUS [Hondaea fermentalgiana]